MQDFLMNLELRYGEENWRLEFPKEKILDILKAKTMHIETPEKEVINNALQNPIGTPPLREIVKAGRKVVIIINDMTRLWVRHHIFMPYLLKELERGGIKDKDILLISATGAHREQTENEWKMLVGEEMFNRLKIIDHRSEKQEEMINLGETTYGTPIEINKEILNADHVILTGGIVYHFLAGYGGGKKALQPGVASYNSIMENHKLSLNPNGRGLNPNVKAGKLKGNPLSDDMVQVAEKVGVDFIFNVVIDEEEHKIAYAFAGDLKAAHEKGAEVVDYYFGIPIKEQADLIIASCGGYPKDIDFYQTYKTVHNMVPAMKSGGVGILLTESREGIGKKNFYSIFTDHNNNIEREYYLRDKYDIASFMGFSEAIWTERFNFIVISSLADEKIKNMNMIPAKDLDKAIEIAEEKLPKDYKAYIMPSGAVTYPILDNTPFL